MENRPKVGVGVFVIKEGKVLFHKRKGAHGEGNWSIPGGHLEFGETIEECSKREVFEEAGIRIKNVKLGPYTQDVFLKENKHYVTIFTIAEYESGEIQIIESEYMENLEWFSPNNIPTPLFLPIQTLIDNGFEISKIV